jgi:hypothetical protein
MMGVFAAARAEAAIISVVPVSQTVALGDPVSVELVVVGLKDNESVGGVSLTLSFNDSILAGASYLVDPDFKMGVALDPFNDFSAGFAGGNGSPLELVFLADISLDHTALKALQGASFTLATVTFDAIANGLSLLTLGDIGGEFLSNADGLLTIPTQAANGLVCVGGNCQVVPEPATFALLALGAGALAIRRRRQVHGA